MALTVDLPEDIERRLRTAAECEGMQPDAFAVKLLDRHLPGPARRSALIDLLQSWIDDPDDADQKETGDFLIRALDEDRPGQRKLFPPELKGKSW